MKLPKSLIKKYGISKKAWSVFKSRSSGKKKKSRSNKFNRGNQMAKRRSKRYGRRRSKSGGMKATAILLSAGIYGALRSKVSNALIPITAKIPLGSVADEAALFGVSYLLNKKTSGLLKSVGLMGMAVEGARIGEAVIDGSAFSNSAGVGSANGVTYATIA